MLLQKIGNNNAIEAESGYAKYRQHDKNVRLNTEMENSPLKNVPNMGAKYIVLSSTIWNFLFVIENSNKNSNGPNNKVILSTNNNQELSSNK